MDIAILILLSVTALLNLLTVFVLSVRNKNNKAARKFTYGTASVIFWCIGAILLETGKTPNVLTFGKILWLVAPMFTLSYFAQFAYYFNGEIYFKVVHKIFTWFTYITTVIVSLSSSLIIPRIEVAEINKLVINKIYFIAYAGVILGNFVLGVWILVVKANKLKGRQRLQIQLSLLGCGLSAFFAVISNIFLPLVGVANLVWLGPIFTVFYISITAYSIIKQKLFDISSLVARYIGSILLTGIISFVYFYVLAVFVSKIESTSLYLKIGIASTAAVIYSFSFHAIRQFISSITGKVFFSAGYDTQVLLDELGEIWLKNPELERLTLLSSEKIINTMNITKLNIKYTGDASPLGRELWTLLENDESKVLLVDDLMNTFKRDYRKLIDNEVSVIAPLKAESKVYGAILYGQKRNGSTYTKQDLITVSLVSDSLSLAIQNAKNYQEIAKFNISLQRKVEDRTKELKRSNDKLQALDTAKDEFISMASHQLRTPLTSVKGYVSMVLDGDAGPINDQQRQLLSQSFASSQRMVYLIADLLNVSRLRTGKFVIDAKPTYLPDVVASEIDQLSDTAKARSLEIVFQKPAKFPMLMLDETKIRQVIMNFTDNAMYYTPSGGRIEIELKELKHAIEFNVHDNGIGVPKSEQHHLFTKFYRAGNARKARPDGTGLGLFMAKKVIVAQGGAVIFRSIEGKGSTFGFTFPKEKLKVGSATEKVHEQ